mgnify:CR=1 FL=1
MNHIFYVHGAGASPRSFAWLKDQLPKHYATMVSYTLKEDVATVVTRLRGELARTARPVTIIGHSLGGIIATLAADAPEVQRVVTLCAPFNGLRISALLQAFSNEPPYRDTAPFSASIRALRHPHGKPHLAICGTAGLPLGTPNDGVVSVHSQTALTGPVYHALPYNHFEILMAEETAGLIRAFAF